MKTNQVLKSADRELFGVIVPQQTKDMFVSVTSLQKAYEKGRWMYGWTDRRINDILQYKPVQERIYHLINERGMIKASQPVFMDMIEREGIVKVLKGIGAWKTTGRGENKAVFADPYIWVLLALELNPLIYAKVIIWVTDSLIFDRLEAGNEFRPMNAAIGTVIQNPDYAFFAKEINIQVFGSHQTGMRNLASAQQLKKIADMEKFIARSITNGFIKTKEDVIKAIKSF